ncbi:very-long-chain aldehyde decarbonylase GL1-10-like [Lolium rigidum]|uniref:very-long-chain aldehyde decarbonylase GL1-10-like n=1 Tax=Lolium rigidum TaxID=89674 RepID=UPI001F5E1E89|nr:very-long-chain aldehyde decarbonylase GL1-10-like [Lolium rigidum]
MLPYATAVEAEAALGRAMTGAEAAWFRYSAALPDHLLYCQTIAIILIVHTLAGLPLALLELRAPPDDVSVMPYKLQPRVRLSRAQFLRCYLESSRLLVLHGGALSFVSYPAVKMLGIGTGLRLPSAGQTAAQLVVYLLVQDYVYYWIHRVQHTRWVYRKAHRVHHEFSAPFGFVAQYAHWADVLLLGVPAMAGPAIAPCHMTTLWLWFAMLQLIAIDVHSGFDFPLNPTKLIPFYGGAQYHDHHHRVGEHSHSNFAPTFTYCDYLYGTDKGYRRHKASLEKVSPSHL